MRWMLCAAAAILLGLACGEATVAQEAPAALETPAEPGAAASEETETPEEQTPTEEAPEEAAPEWNMLTGADYRVEERTGTYAHHQTGNPTWVRQYDGRTFFPFNIEFLNMFGYKKNLQYWFTGRDLFVGNEDIFLKTLNRNSLGLVVGTSSLTHRLWKQPDVDPYTFGELTNLRAANPAIPQLSLGRDWDSFIDLSPNGNYRLDRRVTAVDLYGDPVHNQRVRLVGGWWQQDEGGNRQLLFRSRTAGAAVPSGLRGGVSEPISRTTGIGSVGTDVSIGNGSVVNYRFQIANFDGKRNWPSSGSSLDFLPLNSLTQISTHTTSHILKARTNITGQLSFTGSYVHRSRENNSNDIPPGYENAGQTLSKKTRQDSTNLALVYRPTDALTFTGRYRQFDQDALVPPVYLIVSGVPQTTPGNQALSQSTKQVDIEGTYSGLARAFFRLGYERRDVDRSSNPIHAEHEEFEHPFTSEETNWNIVRLKARWYPTLRFSLSAGYENWIADNSGYNGTADDRLRVDANGTYMLRDDMAVYANFNVWNDRNDQIRVPFSDIPTIPPDSATADYTAIRQAAAGESYKNDTTTFTIGTWYALNSRLSLDANYGKYKQDAQGLWIIGTDPAFTPHLAPDLVPFKGNSDQWSLGSTYVLNPTWRLRGYWMTSTSSGVSYVDPAIYQDLGPVWTPFDIHMQQWMVGVSHDLTDRDRVDFDFTYTNWDDKVDQSQDGSFGLWRLAYSRTW